MKLYNLQNQFIKEANDFPSNFTGIIEYRSGSKRWYFRGKLHRFDGPACEWIDGTKEWWIDGKLHRLDGPAIEYSDGTKEWWIGGKLHRLDGPAIEYSDGTKYWFVDGEKINCSSNEQFNLLVDLMKLKGLM